MVVYRGQWAEVVAIIHGHNKYVLAFADGAGGMVNASDLGWQQTGRNS